MELVNDFVEVVSERENKDQPMMPTTIFAEYKGSEEPTKMVKMKV